MMRSLHKLTAAIEAEGTSRKRKTTTMTKLIAATSMILMLTSIASACPDYIMSCTAKGREAMGQSASPPPPPPRVRTTTCTTIRTRNGSYTECTSS
jgi:hypothetical protein